MKSLLVVAIFLVFVTSSWVFAQGARGNPKDGQVLYQQHCLRCHGEKLDGNGPDGEYLIIRPANFLSQGSRAKTDWELLVTITNGALFTPMHGFRGKLSDQQILDVLSYIRSVAPFDTVS
ncbi:MAG TPA: cytochrome c [Nitrospira sp.]|nr:cytochrome c [Nitrospira sp.]